MAEKQQRVSITIPSDIDALGRRVLGQQIIDFIQSRTDRGLDVNNSAFAPYSQTYRDSEEFAIAGKSGTVNLRLTGDMMSSLVILSESPGEIVIGFEAGTDENDKAAWVSDFDNGPSRQFLGINPQDLSNLITQFRAENPDNVESQDRIAREARSIINRLLRN